MLCDISTACVNGKSISHAQAQAAVSLPRMNGLTDRIQKRLAATGKSARAASLEAGLSDAFIRNILKGKSGSPSADNLAKLAPVLGTTEVWLLRAQGPEEVAQTEFRERIHSVPAGQEFEPDAEFVEDETRSRAAQSAQRRTLQPGEVIEREVIAGLGIGGDVGTIMVDGIVQENVRAIWRLPPEMIRAELQSRETDLDFITVEGDSMAPTLAPGDRVLVNRAMSRPGDGVFVIHDGLGPSVKRLEVLTGTSPLRIAIISDNPHHTAKEILAEDLAVIGRVIGRFSRM